MFHRHRSFFPLVLALLTILLVVLMIWKLQPPAAGAPSSPATEEISADPVTPAEYETHLADLLGKFFQKYDAADQDFIRVIIADETLSALLDLKVPAQYKELHLAVAVNLNLIQRGLTDEPARLNEGLSNLQSLRQAYSWLP